MSDETPTPEPAEVPTAESAAEPVRRRPWKRRLVRRVLGVGIALIAGLFVLLFTADLGRLWPGLVTLAEREGSKYLERPLHIGRISAALTPGHFVLEDVVIEGRQPGDRPYMSIKRIDIEVPWWTLLRRELHVRVTLDDWQLVVESWPNGTHNIPRLTSRSSGGDPLPFVTTVDWTHARRGSFTYEDHGTPWKVVAPNLNFSLVRVPALGQYRGLAGFSGGAVQIQSFQPLATSMTTRFILDGSKVRLEHLDLVTDGSRSHVNGDLDFRRWPNQVYYVNSEIDFERMKEIFFTREPWQVGGQGTFTGTFKVFPGGRDLSGEFRSDTASVDGLEFPNLHGALTWTQALFAVTHAETDFLGGHARFDYSLAPLGSPTGSMATFSADYSDIDVFELDRLMNLRGLKIAGLASGDLFLQWPNGKFGTARTGHGRTRVNAPDGVVLARADLPDRPVPPTVEPRPFDPARRPATLLVGVNTSYAIDPDGITFGPSTAATSHSFVTFGGRTARDGSSRFPFHVTSHDWQESDRLLASIMTAVGGPTNAIEVSGRGMFDGEMTGSFSAPRITGRFTGESMKVWDVVWGRAHADLVIEGGYVDITNSRVGESDASSIVPRGRFALGYRRDGRDEITARVVVTNWPLADLRHAFQLDSWPMAGTIALADLNLTGKYREMFGSGVLRIANGRAWDEPFELATGDLVLEGTGMQISRMEMTKGPGVIRGAARIGWDGTYAFNAAGENVAVESLENFALPNAPLTGRLRFNVSGASEFENPTYRFEGSIEDLFVADEGIGAVDGSFVIAGKTMTIDRLRVASSRLQVLGSGTVEFDEQYTSDLRLRFSETALDPYLKFVMTDDISPYTRIVVGGSLAVRGPVATPKSVLVDATIDNALLTLYEHGLRNDGPVRLRLEGGQFTVQALKLAGEGTNLDLSGGGDLNRRTLNLSSKGSSSLAILGLFPQFSGITASGAATLDASLTGGFDTPRLAGSAVLAEGRIRPLNSPHSLEAINGRIEFGVTAGGANAINMRDVTGRVADGEVVFGGDIEFDGFELARYNLTATGRSMRLRYPAGFRSTVNMDLQFVGPRDAPRLAGSVDVLRVALISSGDTGLLGLAGAGTVGVQLTTAPPTSTSSTGTPLALAIKVTAPPLNFIDVEDARVAGQADLDVRGTFDAPVITGRIDIEGGELHAFANRFVVREGYLEFNERQAEPIFDVSAETRTRVEGTTYTITLRLSGSLNDVRAEWSSDPSLPTTDIVNIVVGGTPSVLTAEQRSLGASEQAQQQMLAAVAAAVLTNALTSRVGDVVEDTLAVDTVQITPMLSNTSNFQQQNPSARITLGKRISQRVYLTYSRTVGNIEEEIILLEYDQNDRLSWVLSKNEDRTVALDFRFRFVF